MDLHRRLRSRPDLSPISRGARVSEWYLQAVDAKDAVSMSAFRWMLQASHNTFPPNNPIKTPVTSRQRLRSCYCQIGKPRRAAFMAKPHESGRAGKFFDTRILNLFPGGSASAYPPQIGFVSQMISRQGTKLANEERRPMMRSPLVAANGYARFIPIPSRQQGVSLICVKFWLIAEPDQPFAIRFFESVPPRIILAPNAPPAHPGE